MTRGKTVRQAVLAGARADRSPRFGLALALAALIFAAWAWTSSIATQTARAQAPEIHDLVELESLRARFNADRGRPRLVLLLSPT